MDPSRFDALSRAVLTRRHALLGSALFALIARTVSGSDAGAEEVQAEACIPNGPVCGQRKRRRKRHGKHKHRGRRRDRKRGAGCSRCCSGCTAGTDLKTLRCACCPAGSRCARGDQCCSGSCRQGICQGVDAGPESCPTPTTPPCNPNPQLCGPSDATCACYATVNGANGCFSQNFVCYEDQTTCTDDADCRTRFGAGFGCVSASGCQAQCGGNGNACHAPCGG